MNVIDYLNTKVLVSQDMSADGAPLNYYIMDRDGIRKVGASTKMNKEVHIQDIPSKIWTVQHELNTTDLIIETFTTGGQQIYGHIQIETPRLLYITFDESITGRAVLLGG